MIQATSHIPNEATWSLSPRVVDVWSAWLDQSPKSFNHLKSLLSREERERAGRFLAVESRNHFIAGRGLLRLLLGRYLQVEPHHIEFRYGTKGKPFLAFPSGVEVAFNLSHSSGLALYAFTIDRQVGIDVEKAIPIDEAESIADRFFSPDEAMSISRDRRSGSDVFYHYWTRREALCKCRGDGIGEFEHCNHSFNGFITELHPAEGYVAALAVEGSELELRLRHWPDAMRSPESSAFAGSMRESFGHF